MTDLIGYDFIQHLAEQGVITKEMAKSVRRVVIDAQRNAIVRMYIEMAGSDLLLSVSMLEDPGIDVVVFEAAED